jgi:hypothetical protein
VTEMRNWLQGAAIPIGTARSEIQGKIDARVRPDIGYKQSVSDSFIQGKEREVRKDNQIGEIYTAYVGLEFFSLSPSMLPLSTLTSASSCSSTWTNTSARGGRVRLTISYVDVRLSKSGHAKRTKGAHIVTSEGRSKASTADLGCC